MAILILMNSVMQTTIREKHLKNLGLFAYIVGVETL